MKKETIIGICSVAVLIMCIVGLIVELDSKKETSSTATSNYIQDQFMSGCVGSSDTATYTSCNCMYNALVSKFGVDGFINMSVTYKQTGVLPENTYPIIVSCLGK